MPKSVLKNVDKKEKNKPPKPKQTSKNRKMPDYGSGANKNNQKRNALIIGGGIAGIQAALDLADAGVNTYIVERTPSIGGRMAQLDKTFPTNDCAMCILSPKLVSVARHPNIELLTNSEVVTVTGTAGNFKVTIKKHPRYIDENKCVGCGECATKCPSKVPNEFDLGLGLRKAIYTPFPQAVPLVYTIDPEHCKYLLNGKCGTCAKICKANAIDYEQKEEQIKLNIGAIIVSTGFEQYNPQHLEELGYSEFENVITGLEFERMLNASGPTMGKIIKKSDGKPPRNILFIQCVGSRDKHRAQEYCSRICCMYAIKEAMIAKEHQADLNDIKILNMEIRAYGKGFEEYYQRAKTDGIEFIQGRPAEIIEDAKTKELVVKFEDVKNGKINELKTDLVILSSAVIPNDSNQELSKILDIGLDDHGFFQEANMIAPAPSRTKGSGSNTGTLTELGVGSCAISTKPGIFLSGCAQGPKDIPDSVAQGSAAAALAGNYLGTPKILKTAESCVVKLPTEITGTADEVLRIGVFVCRCGINIGGILDVPELVKYSKSLPDVVFATENLYTCSDDTQTLIQEMIKEHKLNRVIVASCTPRTHEPIFRDTCARAGLNPYLFEMANIRDQCSWVHMNEPDKGTEKAKDLLRMAVARTHYLAPLIELTTPVTKSALVIGGGIAGMQCAIDLAAQGIETNLVEIQPKLGGRLNQLNNLTPSNNTPKQLVAKKIKQLQETGVNVLTNSKLLDIQGYVGNFNITIEQLTIKDRSKQGRAKQKKVKSVELSVGAIVLAIGSELYDPNIDNEYGYGNLSNVISSLDLEMKMKNNELKLKPNKKQNNIVFISCVGAREQHKENGNIACSRYCCKTMLNQAIELQNKGANVTVLHKGVRAFSKYSEELYFEASRLGVRFIQIPEDQPPKVNKAGTTINTYDVALDRKMKLPSDLIILSLAMIPNQNETKKLQEWLKIPLSGDGFFLELHPKLGPVETNTLGIYLCGCAQGPKDVADTLNQASGAAAKVAALLSKPNLTIEPITAVVNHQICWGCGSCEEICPYGAPQIVKDENGVKQSSVNSALCKGCGACAANCPSGAIVVNHYTNEQISSMIKAFGEVTG